jgi:hypothetical protein
VISPLGELGSGSFQNGHTSMIGVRKNPVILWGHRTHISDIRC